MNLRTWDRLLTIAVLAGFALIPAVFDLSVIRYVTGVVSVIAILIGLVDGFNPCAMWVLIFLITMLFDYPSKKKMWILGCTFLFTSAFIYFLFILSI